MDANLAPPAKELLLGRVVTYVAHEGIADRSLRQIAAGVGTSHRMLLHHFGSREGLLAAIVGTIEAQQRADMLTMRAASARELMRQIWDQVSSPEFRPFVRLFFEVFGLAAQGAPGTEALLAGLTGPWLADGAEVARGLGIEVDEAALRLGVAVSRGLLLELLAGADPAKVDASYQRFLDLAAP